MQEYNGSKGRCVEYGDLILESVQPPEVGAPVRSGYVLNGAWLLKVEGRDHQACTWDGSEVVNAWQQDVPVLKHDRIVERAPLPEGYDDDIAF